MGFMSIRYFVGKRRVLVMYITDIPIVLLHHSDTKTSLEPRGTVGVSSLSTTFSQSRAARVSREPVLRVQILRKCRKFIGII